MFDDEDTEEEHTDELDIGQGSDLNNSASIEDRGELVKETRGRKGLWIHFPQLIDVVDTFLSSVGFAAHGRRRETTGIVGASIENIRRHISTRFRKCTALN